MLLSCIFGTEYNVYNRYIARTDGSPLMEALVLWREAAIKGRIDGLPSRPSSPSSDGEDTKGKETFNDRLSSDERGDHERSTLHVPERTSRKPTSSSWVRWWRRGQAKDADIQANRQNLNGLPTDSAEVFTSII
jgi:phosphatidate phosphatase LPIN